MTIFTESNLSGNQHFLIERVTNMGNQIGDAVGIGNPLGLIFILAVFAVAFAGAKIFSFGRSLTVASFLGSITSLILVRMGWLSSSIFYIMIISFCIGIFVLIAESSTSAS